MGPNYWKFLLAMVQPVTVGRGCLGKLRVDYGLNVCLVCIGSGMTVDCGFTK